MSRALYMHVGAVTRHLPYEDCVVIGGGRELVGQAAPGCLLIEVPTHAVWPEKSTWADTAVKLRAAATVIRANGLHHGDVVDRDQVRAGTPAHLAAVDTLGALAIAHTGSPEVPDDAETWPAVQHLAAFVGGEDRYSFEHTACELISAWNDDPGPFGVPDTLADLADSLERLLSTPNP
jgi:hypothetical protein